VTKPDTNHWVTDSLQAGAVALVSVGFAVPNVEVSLLSLALSLSLVFRRSMPVVALVWAGVVAVAHAVLLPSLTLSIIVVPVLVYSTARWSDRLLAWVALGLAVAGAVAGPTWWLWSRAGVDAILVTVGAYAGVVIVAHVVALRERDRASAQVVRRRLEFIQQEQRAEERVAAERNEIAREVHDIVAHSLSMIAVQAEGGRALVMKSPARAPEVLTVIAEESRAALNEIRDMVGVLRRGRAAYRPAPRFEDVRELVDRLGDRAKLSVSGEVRPIGPILGLTLYRVVQESLTNFLRHAGPSARVGVNLVLGETSTTVTVRDTGLGSAAATDGKGHGLQAMRERVLARGGTLTAGAVSTGGYEVCAVFPMEST
jgi:signal transduction histidine kinase